MNFSKSLVGTLACVASVLCTFSAQALPSLKVFPVHKCPAIGEEFETLLSKLDTIKASVKDGANCANVATQVQTLEALLVQERQRVLDLMESGHQQPLTAEQSEQVRRYAENLTKKVASLYNLFTGTNKCFRDDEAAESSLAAMAGFVNEAARLTASLTGPWGTPIALGGHVVAGFLTGLDHVMKARVGFDFEKPEQWKNYVQNLCTFHSYRDQIEHLLNPQVRITQLQNLRIQLDSNIAILNSRCEECRGIESNFEAYGSNSPAVLNADQRFSKPFGTYMLYSVGIRNWVSVEIKRVERESASFWADVSGRHLLSRAREDLEQFLVVREGPRFLAHQTGRTARDFGHFQAFSLDEGRALYDQIHRINPAIVTQPTRYYFAQPLDFFRSLLVSPLRWDVVPAAEMDELKFSWAHYRDRGLSHLRNAEASLATVEGFCSFFKLAGHYSARMKSVCTSEGVRRVAGEIADLEQQLASVQLGTGALIDLSTFDPAVRSLRSPRTPVESLHQFVEQMNPN